MRLTFSRPADPGPVPLEKSNRTPRRILFAALGMALGLSMPAAPSSAAVVAGGEELIVAAGGQSAKPVHRFKVDANGALVPDLRAAAAIIYIPETGEVIWEEHSQDQRSIASITKVMTAAVFLESNPDMERQVVIQRSDTLRASWTYLRTGERVRLEDLFHLLLVASDNAAARAIARTSPWGAGGFVQRMNDKAAELGLTSTVYADPSGLDAENMSSAYDMARLIAYVAADERISSVMRLPSYTYKSSRRRLTVKSTNLFVRTGEVDVLGGKTGFIRKAGYCFVTLLKLPDVGPQLALVVLGARSNAARFTETRNLVEWVTSRASDLFSQDSSGK